MSFLEDPQPFPQGLPFPTAAPVSLFGLTGAERQIQDATGLAPDPTPFAQLDSGIFAPASALSALTGGGVTSDPREWTPEEAAAQTDRALARIAQVNPELAQDLQSQRTGEQPEDGGSFFDQLMNSVSKVLHVTHLDTVLELVGRTSHIVPEIVMDWGKESVWKNASDALLGKSDVSWDDIMSEKWGWDRNWLTATAGFLGDVVTDPLTILGFGGGGVARETIGNTVAKATITDALEKGGLEAGERVAAKYGLLLEDIMQQTGAKTAEEAAAALMRGAGPERFGTAGKGLLARVRRAVGMAHPDAQGGLVYSISQSVDKAAVEDLLRLGDDAFKHATTSGWQRVTVEAAAQFGIDKKSVDSILKGWVSRTGLTLGDRAGYEASKTAAAALGGFRVRMSIPILGLRLSTNRLPLLGARMDFSIGRRFMAGLSGEVRLMRMVGRGEAGADSLRAFWERGFKGLQEYDEVMAKKLAGGKFLSGGRITYPLSESIGEITKHLSPSAKILRGGGLAAKYAADMRRMSAHIEAQLLDETRTITLAGGRTVAPRDVNMVISKTLTNLDDPSDVFEYTRLMHGAGVDEAAEPFWNARIRQAILSGADPRGSVVRAMESARDKAIAVEQRLSSAGAIEGARYYRVIYQQVDEMSLRNGIETGVVQGDVLTEDLLNPADEDELLRNTATHGRTFVEDGTTRPPGGRWDEDALTNGPDDDPIFGVTLRETTGTPEAETGRVAVARALNLYQVDRTTTPGLRAATETVNVLDELDQQANAAYDAVADAIGMDTPALRDLRQREVSAGRTVTQAKQTAKKQANRAAEAAAVDAKDAQVRAAHQFLDNVEEEEFLETVIEEAGGDADLLVKARNHLGLPGDATLDDVKNAAADRRGVLADERATMDPVLNETDRGVSNAEKLANRRTGSPYQYKGPQTPPVKAPKGGDPRVAEAVRRTTNPTVSEAEERLAGIRADIEHYQALMETLKDSDAARKAFVASFKTRELQRLNYDGLEVSTDAGKRVTIFRNADGTIPVWWRAKGANRNMPYIHGGPRMATEQVLAAIRQSKTLDRPGVSEPMLREQIRLTAHLDQKTAESRLRNWLKDNGVDLRENQTVLDNDPVRVITRYAERAAKEAKDKAVGRYARELERLGFGRSVFMGGQVQMQKYQLLASETAAKAVDRVLAQEQLARERLELFDKKTRVVELQAQAEAVADDLARMYQDTAAKVQRVVDDIEQGGRIASQPSMRARLRERTRQDRERTALRFNEWSNDLMRPESRHQTKFRRLRDELAMRGPSGDFKKLEEWTEDGTKYEMWRKGRLESQGDFATYYIVNPADTGTPIRSVRTVDWGPEGQTVDAVTATPAKRKGFFGRLHRQHWTDIGIIGPDGELDFDKMYDAVHAQALSEYGADANLKQIDKYVNEYVDRVVRGARDAQRELDIANMDVVEATNEVNKILAREVTKEAPQLAAWVPAENALNMAGMQRLSLPGFEDVAMPTFMAQEFERAIGGHSLAHMSSAHRAFRQFNNVWKSMATWLWPGFHIRNVEGSFFNNWLGGVHTGNYIVAQRVRKAAHEVLTREPGAYRWATEKLAVRDAKFVATLRRTGLNELGGIPLEDITYADFAAYTGGLGITSNNGRSFAESRTGWERVERPTVSERTPGLRQYAKAAQGAGTLTENLFRTAAFVKGLESYGNAMDARLFTMMRHGDYHDLTDFEFGVVKDLIPFYKWMRTNLPFQVHQLLESPGKLLAVQKAGEAVYTGMGLDYDEEKYKMPEWMRGSLGMPLPGPDGAMTMMALDLPMSDLHMSGREFFSSFLPLARPFLESFVTHQTTFTGAPLEGKPVEVAGPFRPLLPILLATGLADTGPGGQHYISDRTQNILNIFPIFARFRNFMYADEDRKKGRVGSIASMAFGVSIRDLDKSTMTDTELQFYYSQVLPTLEWLRGIGYQLPTTDDLEAMGQTTDQVLTSMGIEPGGIVPEEEAA